MRNGRPEVDGVISLQYNDLAGEYGEVMLSRDL